MINKINGHHFLGLIDYGVRNLTLYRDRVNALNVFPVPDGDTGTNMVMTLESGFNAIDGREGSLSELARSFAGAVILGARGNSGVIISQFFKGFSECFFELDEADTVTFSGALDKGVEYAYHAVSNPVEGTVLTVLREASTSVHEKVGQGGIDTIDELILRFLDSANESLKHTPDILPVLKSAGVVDSGGAGIIYVFDGMRKYLAGDEVSKTRTESRAEIIDYTKYNSESKFEFGYCTELLIQLTVGSEPLNYDSFKAELDGLGESVVTALEGDKLKVHIHTHTPERILAFCHRFGEFLNLKIENMSVQHHELHAEEETSIEGAHIASINEARCEYFAVIAVAHEPSMAEQFSEMGADLVISASHHCPPSAADFIDAFAKIEQDTIFVFPNSKNTILAAEQAKNMYSDAKILVFDTKSDAECYSALPMIDYEESDVEAVQDSVSEVLENLYVVNITKATKDAVFSNTQVRAGNYVAMAGHELVATSSDILSAATDAISSVTSCRTPDVVTVFVNEDVTDEVVDKIEEHLSSSLSYSDTGFVRTKDDFFEIVISFE